MKLTPIEIERYKRHLVLRDVGGQGQQKLKAARVLVIGAGGLGRPASCIWRRRASARSASSTTTSVSLVEPAAPDRARYARTSGWRRSRAPGDGAALNPHVTVSRRTTRGSTAANAMEIICALRHRRRRLGQLRHALSRQSDACYLAKKPLVFGAVGPFDGYVTTFKPHETAPDGKPFPTYRCSFPSRRRRARWPTAPRSACSAPWSASSARCRRPRC